MRGKQQRQLAILKLYILWWHRSCCCAWMVTPTPGIQTKTRIHPNTRASTRPRIHRFRINSNNNDDNDLHESSDSNSSTSSTTRNPPKTTKDPPPPPSPETVNALSSLAQTILALLSGDESTARTLCGSAAQKKQLVEKTFRAYDICGSGTLSVDEARALFIDLSQSIVASIASSSCDAETCDEHDVRDVARSHARRVLEADERGTNTIERVATKLLILADKDEDGRIDVQELAGMFDAVYRAQDERVGDTFPQPLMALAGSLQLLPPTVGTGVAEAAGRTLDWHLGVPGDDHTLRRVELERGLSIVGLGRSADASAYFLPELSLVLDAGFHVKSLHPKLVLLTHGHRDHIAALPAHAPQAQILAPRRISSLVRRFLLAEAQLNYGNDAQTDEETVAALGEFDIRPVEDGDDIRLPRSSYTGSSHPLGVQVFAAPHKDGVPAVSYGLYREQTRLKPEFAALPKSELGALIRDDVEVTESYQQGVLFYTGDTTIDLLRDRYQDILPKYRHVIHEVTFLGQPSLELDEDVRRKGHTHYSQLHPWICAFPETTFVCVHWSLRYSRSDVLEFFEEQYGGVPKNVVLWI